MQSLLMYKIIKNKRAVDLETSRQSGDETSLGKFF